MISTVLNINHVTAVISFCINANKQNQPAVKEQKIAIIKDLDINILSSCCSKSLI